MVNYIRGRPRYSAEPLGGHDDVQECSLSCSVVVVVVSYPLSTRITRDSFPEILESHWTHVDSATIDFTRSPIKSLVRIAEI